MTAREVLGERVRERRLSLGLTQHQAADAAGVSDQTWVNVEQGKKVSDRTLAGINRAVGWRPGSAEDVLGGGEPVEIPARNREPVTREEFEELRRRVDDLIARQDERDELQDRYEALLAADERTAAATRAVEEAAQRRDAERERERDKAGPRSA